MKNERNIESDVQAILTELGAYADRVADKQIEPKLTFFGSASRASHVVMLCQKGDPQEVMKCLGAFYGEYSDRAEDWINKIEAAIAGKGEVTEVEVVEDDPKKVPGGVVAQEAEKELRMLEVKIKIGFDNLLEMGRAFKIISDKKLYILEGFATMQDYCQKKWARSYSRIHRIIQAGEITENVAHGQQMGLTPKNERQTRELAKVPKSKQAEVWDKAVTNAGGTQPTASDIKAVVDSKLDTSKVAKLANVIKDSKPEIEMPENVVETPIAEEKPAPAVADMPTAKTDKSDSVTLPREVVKFFLENMLESVGDDYTKMMEKYPEASETIMSIA